MCNFENLRKVDHTETSVSVFRPHQTIKVQPKSIFSQVTFASTLLISQNLRLVLPLMGGYR